MGFPFDLWLKEPEEWGDSTGGMPRSAEVGGEGAPADLAGLLRHLMNSIVDSGTGESLSDRDVSMLTEGRLSEEDVAAIRRGEVTNPTRAQLLALSDAFDIDPSYWFRRRGSKPHINPQVFEALKDEQNYALLQKGMGLTNQQKRVVMSLMDQLAEMDTRVPEAKHRD
jgi:transcriptional regulator with XRE-family HTH domain